MVLWRYLLDLQLLGLLIMAGDVVGIERRVGEVHLLLDALSRGIGQARGIIVLLMITRQ